MVSLLDFVVELLVSVVDLLVIFTTEVVFSDPLSAISVTVGGALTVGTVAFFTYLVVGALLAELGVDLPTPGRTPKQERRGESGQ
jgi:hypothetical protein